MKNSAKHLLTLESNKTTGNPKINIAFAVDKNYLKPCGICIYSILKNNPDVRIDFHIFTDNFDSFGFDSLCNNFDNIKIHIYKLNSEYFDSLQVNYHFTTAMYYRIAIADILKDITDFFIYLDADIICDNSITPIISLDLSDHIIAAVSDGSFSDNYKTELGLSESSLYFNSGVLLINTKAWLSFEVFKKFQKLISNKKYQYPDQDVLNLILSERTLFIDEKYNDLFQEKNRKSIFVHYVSSPKPWTLASEYNKRYMAYYKSSPWGELPQDKPRNYRDARKLSEKLMKDRKIFSAIKWYLIYIAKKINK